MGGVIGADAHGVQLLIVQHGLMIGVEMDVGIIHAHLFAEGLGLAGDQIGHGHHFHIRELLVLLHVRFRDPARADNADPQLFRGVNLFFFHSLGELTQNGVAICHDNFLLHFSRPRSSQPIQLFAVSIIASFFSAAKVHPVAKSDKTCFLRDRILSCVPPGMAI